MKKACATCGQTFEGRANKQYCSTACKSAVNNKRQAEINSEEIEENRALRKNKKVLALLHKLFEEKPFSGEYLKKYGYNHIYSTKQIAEGFSMYGYCLIFAENNLFKVKKTKKNGATKFN